MKFPEQVNPYEQKADWWLLKTGSGEWVITALIVTGCSFGVMKMFLNYRVVVFAQHWKCAKCNRITYFKMVNFMLREFHLKKTNKQTHTQRSIDPRHR